MENKNSNKQRFSIGALVLCLLIVAVAGLANLVGDEDSTGTAPMGDTTFPDPGSMTMSVTPGSGAAVKLFAHDGNGNAINTEALNSGQVFQVDIRLNACSGDIVDLTTIQFDASRLSAGSLTGDPMWNGLLFPDSYTLSACDFTDSPGEGMPDCTYFTASDPSTGIFAAYYLYPWYDSTDPLQTERAPAKITCNCSGLEGDARLAATCDPAKGGQLIATLNVTYDPAGATGQLDVCGPENEYNATGIALVSGFYDPGIYNEYFDNIFECATPGVGTLVLKRAVQAAPVVPDIDNPICSRFSYPWDRAIDARAEKNSSGAEQGFDWVDIRFNGPVTTLTPADFIVRHFPNPTEAGAPTIVGVAAAPSDTRTECNSGGNVARLTFSGKPKPGKWTVVKHVASGRFVRLGFFPGDVDRNGLIGQHDRNTALRNCLRTATGGSCAGYEFWEYDISGNGTLDAPTNGSVESSDDINWWWKTWNGDAAAGISAWKNKSLMDPNSPEITGNW